MNSPNIDQFPPELLHGVPADRLEPVGRQRHPAPDALQLQPAQGDPRGGLRQADGAGERRTARARTWRCSTIVAYNGYLVALERAKVAAEVVRQKEKHLEMAKNRREAGVATDLEVLRFEVDLANARTELLRLRRRCRPRPRRPQRRDGAAHGHADRAHGHARLRRRARAVELAVGAPGRDRPGPSSRPRPGTRRSTTRRSASTRPTRARASTSTPPTATRCGTPATSSSRTTRSGASASRSRCRSSTACARRARSPRRAPTARASARTGVALETLVDLEAKQALDRLRVARSVLQSAELNVDAGAPGPRDDRGQLPPRRRDDARRDRRPGGLHAGRDEPRRGALGARERPRGAALRDGPGPARGRAPSPSRTTSSEQPAPAGGALADSTAGRQ